MKLLLISGHGAGDPGAVCGSYREADETRKMTASVAGYLEGMADVTVYPTDRNAYEDSRKGTLHAIAGFAQYDYVLEIHFNALSQSTADGSTKGVECYVPTAQTDSTFAAALCRNLAALGLRNRGVKRKNWSVIHTAQRTGTPAALLEVCFIDDPDDMAIYDARFQAAADAIAQAVISTYHLKREDDMTYDTFKEFMDQYLAGLSMQAPHDWSADARTWAEQARIIQGDGTSMRYRSPVMREELVTILYRLYLLMK